jgi:hypothetical protein
MLLELFQSVLGGKGWGKVNPADTQHEDISLQIPIMQVKQLRAQNFTYKPPPRRAMAIQWKYCSR